MGSQPPSRVNVVQCRLAYVYLEKVVKISSVVVVYVYSMQVSVDHVL